MTDDETFVVNNRMTVVPYKQDKGFLIPCQEWDYLKHRIGAIEPEPWLFHSVGFVLLGACVTTGISLGLGAVAPGVNGRNTVIAWAIIVGTAICGGICLYFAHRERAVHRARASDIEDQMTFIERRYDRGDE